MSRRYWSLPMSTFLANQFPNPYASPQAATAPAAKPATPANKPGNIGIVLGGFVLLFAGYIISNIFVISDLYHMPMGPDKEFIPSPFSPLFTTPAQQWTFYVVCAAAFVAGAVMIGSQNFNPIVVVAYVMCPIVGMIYLVASPLRMVQRYADVVAAGYLLVGSCLAFTGATRLFLLYGTRTDGFAPILASMMTEVGLAFIAGAGLKFLFSGSSTAAAAAVAIDPAAEVYVAELAE
jgi:hypothetical protein